VDRIHGEAGQHSVTILTCRFHYLLELILFAQHSSTLGCRCTLAATEQLKSEGLPHGD